MQRLGSDSSPVQTKFTEADAMVLRKVLISCHHRSGSTLLVDLLRAHPHIMCLGEQLPKTNKKETKIERGNPLSTDSGRASSDILDGYKNSRKIWWMVKFLNAETHTSVLLMKCLYLEPTFKRREDLGKHSVYTHFPKERNYEICQRTKITKPPFRRRSGEAVPRAENLGDLITAEHKVLSDHCESRNNHRYAVGVQDLATQWIQAYPCKTKTSQETQRSLQKFLEPEVIYTDNSLEPGKACRSFLESLYVDTTPIGD